MRRLGDETAARVIAARANELAKAVLKVSPQDRVAIGVREDALVDFGLS